eukprot:COSAG03_NODE_835_length_5677_cov_2.833094_2_plen_190_part_00
MFPITGRQDNGAESLWSGNITWERGGWQEARGNEEGKEWHVEGIFEELDSAREWFHDAAAQEIYFIPNSTKTSSSTTQPGNPTEIIAAELQHIVAIVGSSAERPVSNITIRGITFSHSAPTYMEPYEAVSGGDWSFFRDGAVRIENAVGTTPPGPHTHLSMHPTAVHDFFSTVLVLLLQPHVRDCYRHA